MILCWWELHSQFSWNIYLQCSKVVFQECNNLLFEVCIWLWWQGFAFNNIEICVTFLKIHINSFWFAYGSNKILNLLICICFANVYFDSYILVKLLAKYIFTYFNLKRKMLWSTINAMLNCRCNVSNWYIKGIKIFIDHDFLWYDWSTNKRSS